VAGPVQRAQFLPAFTEFRRRLQDDYQGHSRLRKVYEVVTANDKLENGLLYRVTGDETRLSVFPET
jgi:hypothetical protein